MPTVRIWSLESEYDVEKIKRVVNDRVTDLQLGNLSIQASSKNALRRYKIKGASLGDTLR